jgi:hypothetical protein
MADHAPQAARYAVKAMQEAGNADGGMTADRERAWQQDRLPEEIRALILQNG